MVGRYIGAQQLLFSRFNDLTRVTIEYATGAHQRPWAQSSGH